MILDSEECGSWRSVSVSKRQ